MEFIVRWPTTELQEALLSYNQPSTISSPLYNLQ